MVGDERRVGRDVHPVRAVAFGREREARRRHCIGWPVPLAFERIDGQSQARRRFVPGDGQRIGPAREPRGVRVRMRLQASVVARERCGGAVQRDRELRAQRVERRAGHAEAARHRFAADRQRFGERGQPRVVGPLGVEPARELRGARPQRGVGARRQRDEPRERAGGIGRAGFGLLVRDRRPGRARPIIRPSVRGLQHDMRVRSAEAERADARAKRRRRCIARPRHRFRDDVVAAAVELQIRIQLAAMQARRQHSPVHREHDLDDAREARRRFEMSDIGLDRAEAAARRRGRIGMPARARACVEALAQRLHFDRIAQRRAGAVRFDVRNGGGVDARVAIRGLDQRGLRIDVRRGQERRAAAVIDRAALDHRVHRMPARARALERHQHERRDALAAHVAVRRRVERLATPVGAQHAGRGERAVQPRRQHHVDAADDRDAAFAAPQRAHRAVQRDERTRARGIDGLARPVRAEQVRQPVRQHRVRVADREMAVRARQQVEIVGRADADEHRSVAAHQVGRADRRVFERGPRGLHQQALLRVHLLGLARRDAEERGVEILDSRNEAAPARGGLAVGRAPVPARGRRFGDQIVARGEMPPECVEIGRLREDAGHADDRDVAGRFAFVGGGFVARAGALATAVRSRAGARERIRFIAGRDAMLARDLQRMPREQVRGDSARRMHVEEQRRREIEPVVFVQASGQFDVLNRIEAERVQRALRGRRVERAAGDVAGKRQDGRLDGRGEFAGRRGCGHGNCLCRVRESARRTARRARQCRHITWRGCV
ncbi:hypothetical protein BTJ_4025 [Burkholderia thailandensis E444]|nr:hypothetical protein BTJ_4025 [Burkholderia thailandensis E444]